MDTATGKIIPFYRPEQTRAAEREKTLNALKYRIAVSTLERLRKNKEITRPEFELGCELLARRFNYMGPTHELCKKPGKLP